MIRLVCPECGRLEAFLSHRYQGGVLTINATCCSVLCGRVWRVYSVRVKDKGVVIC